MTIEKLKALRLLVPGIMIVVLFSPLFLAAFDVHAFLHRVSNLKILLDSVAAAVLGALYIIFDLRRLANRRFAQQIDDNIKDQFIAACSHDTWVSSKAEELKRGRHLMDVFYRFIDNDNSLKERSKRVMFNGLLWSSVADLVVISAAATGAYAIGYWLTHRLHHLVLVLVGAALCLLGRYLLLPKVTRKHIALSNEQLGYIKSTYTLELCTRIREAA